MTNCIFLTLAGGNEVWINLENVAQVKFHIQKGMEGGIEALVYFAGIEAPLALAGRQAEQLRSLVGAKPGATSA
jgi:hypothetical protein